MVRRFSRTNFYNERYYQLNEELFNGIYRDMNNNERVLYAVLKDKFEISIENKRVDENNDIYIEVEPEQIAEECCISRKVLQHSMEILIKMDLLEYGDKERNQAMRIYLLKPERQIRKR